MNGVFEARSRAPGDTFALGRALGGVMRSGDFLALSGPLGAGKTQFVKGVAAGLGVAENEPVVSPTFVLVREYLGRLKLYHVDAYRLSGAAELLALGLEEMAGETRAVVAVEWADRVPEAIPPHACRIELAHAGRTARDVRVCWPAPAPSDELDAALRRSLANSRRTPSIPG